MVLGFVLIKVGARKEKEIKKELSKIKEIEEIYSLFGEYDMIVKLKVGKFDDLSKIVIDQIRGIDGVEYTKTLTVSNLD